MFGDYVRIPREKYDKMRDELEIYKNSCVGINDECLIYHEALLLACEYLAEICEIECVRNFPSVNCPFEDNGNCANECETREAWAKHFIKNTTHIKYIRDAKAGGE